MSKPASRWWWFIVAFAVCNAVAYLPHLFERGGLLYLDGWPALIAYPFLYLTFLFLGSAFFEDARLVRRSDLGWEPDPYVYGIAGGIHSIGFYGPTWIVILFGVGGRWQLTQPASKPLLALVVFGSGVVCLTYVVRRLYYSFSQTIYQLRLT